MAVQIQTALDVLREPIKVLIYGDNGVGKTQFYASCVEVEELSPGLLIAVDKGAKSAATSYPHPRLETAKCANYKDVVEVRDMLHRGKHKYRSACLDSATFLNHGMINEKRGQLSDSRDPRKWYQEPAMDLRGLVWSFRQMELPFFMTALKDEILSDPNDQKSRIMVRPDFTHQMQIELPGFFDLTGYMHLKTMVEGGRRATRRVIQWKGDQWVWARDSTNSQPEFMQDPTIAQVWANLQAKIKEMENATV